MRKIAGLLLALVLFFSVAPQQAQAATCDFSNVSGVGSNVVIAHKSDSHTIQVTFDTYEQGKKYEFQIMSAGHGLVANAQELASPGFIVGTNATYSAGVGQNGTVTVSGNTVTWTFDGKRALSNDNAAPWAEEDPHYVRLTDSPYLYRAICDVGEYKTSKDLIPKSGPTTCKMYISQERDGKRCYYPGCLVGGGVVRDTRIEVENVRRPDGTLYSGNLYFQIGGPGIPADQIDLHASNGTGSVTFPTKYVGTYSVVIKTDTLGTLCPTLYFRTSDGGSCKNLCSEKLNAYDHDQVTPNFELCEQIPAGSEAAAKCQACMDGTTLGGQQGIWTAIGCVPTKTEGIIKTLVQVALGMGGGITLLLILAGAFKLSVSQGDPKAVEEAREQITSAVIGLLFIIFSITMLRFIGIQVLQIPGFGG